MARFSLTSRFALAALAAASACRSDLAGRHQCVTTGDCNPGRICELGECRDVSGRDASVDASESSDAEPPSSADAVVSSAPDAALTRDAGTLGLDADMPASSSLGDASVSLGCPDDYRRDPSVPGMVVCKLGNDEIVAVSHGDVVFWIDRFEASVWEDVSGETVQHGVQAGDLPSGFAPSAQGTTSLYAVSRSGVKPSTGLTWFQAQDACRARGKRLPTTSEWIEAARGTKDPGNSDGSGARCLTSGSAARLAGDGAGCRSMWGAEDMVGNVAEWADEWYATAGSGDRTGQVWPSGFGGDGVWNVTSAVASGAAIVPGIPAAEALGGSFLDGSGAGVFAISVQNAPSDQRQTMGFRCLLPP
jgi:hypothetical protein